MLSKAEVKIIASLKLKKNRQETGQFVVEGEKTVEEALKAGWTCTRLLLREGHENKLKSDSPILRQGYEEVTPETMDRLTQLSSASPVLGVFGQQEVPWSWQPGDKNHVLVLDQLRDPGNLGTIIRIADWFGLAGVWCSTDTVELWNSKTIQSSMGSIFRVPVCYGDALEFVQKEKSDRIYATVLGGTDLRQTSFGEGGLLLIGSESFGLREALVKAAGHKITIPPFGQAESLNAAVATGIVCSHLRL